MACLFLSHFRIYRRNSTLASSHFISEEQWLKQADSTLDNEQFRHEQIKRYIEIIEQKYWKVWEDIILQCAQTTIGNLTYLISFLELFSKAKPKLALVLIKNNEEVLQRFLPYIINSLLESPLKNETEVLISSWISAGENLIPCADLLRLNKNINEEFLKCILQKAKEQNNIEALSKLVTSVVADYKPDQKFLVQMIFIQSIKKLTELKDSSWTWNTKYQIECKVCIRSGIDRVPPLAPNFAILF